MLVRFAVTAGHHVGKVFEFTDHRTFLVGRAAETHLRFPDDDPFISRLHFLVEVNPPDVRLVDLGSTNGTSVNGEGVSERQLYDGDSIEAGETRISVFITKETNSARAAANQSPLATMVAAPKRQDNGELFANEQDGNEPSEPAIEATLDSEQGTATAKAASQVIGGYHIERELGRGTFGVVYLVSKGDQQFALKQTRDPTATDEKLVRRFIREIKILKQLRHRSLVRFVDAGRNGPHLYLVTEYVAGENLEQLRKRIGPLKTRSAVRIIRHSLLGLAHAHGLGFVHRDIKPANIIVNAKQVKLADFGLAASFQSTMMSGCTLAGESGGSIGYMPPEQLLEFHDAQPTNDIYAIGATLYRLLSGFLPYDFSETFSQRVHMILQNDPMPLNRRHRKLPSELCRVVDRCLSRKPEDRWQSAEELYEALEPFSKSQSTAPQSQPRVQSKPQIVAVSEVPRKARVASGDEQKSRHIAWSITPENLAANEPTSPIANYTASVNHLGTDDYVVGLSDELVFFTATGEVRARYACSARIVGSAAVRGDGRAVVHCQDGMLTCISLEKGMQWQTRVAEPLGWATPLVDSEEHVWVCLSNGGLQRVDADGNCPPRAYYRCPVRLDSTGLVDGPVMYIGGEDGRIHAVSLDGRKGQNIWSEDDNQGRCGWFINGSIQKRTPQEIMAKSGDGYLQGFSLAGQRQWRWRIPGTALADPAVDSQGRIYQSYSASGQAGGGVVCFDPESNTERWSLRLDSGVESTPVLGLDGTLYTADVNGFMHAISSQGKVIWTTHLSATVRSRLSLSADGKLIMGVTESDQVIAVHTSP